MTLTSLEDPGTPSRSSQGEPQPDPKKILTIKLGAVGDLVIASAFFDALRKSFPRSEIILMTGKSSYFPMTHNPCIDRLISVDDYSLFRRGSILQPLEFLRVVYSLKRECFDMVFVLHRAWQFNFLAFLTGASRRVGFARGREGILLTDMAIPTPNRNERETYLDLIRVLDIPVEFERTFYYLSDEEKSFADLFFKRHVISERKRVIAIAPGGGVNVKSAMYIKRWPVEHYIELIKKLRDAVGCEVLILGGPDDRMLSDRIEDECPGIIDATDLTVSEMASVLRKCALFIGNDSAPLHIACSLEVPSIALFGPTNPLEWASQEKHNTIFFKNVECSPCFNQGAFPACDHLTCLRSIEAEEVFRKAMEILSSTATTRSLELADQ